MNDETEKQKHQKSVIIHETLERRGEKNEKEERNLQASTILKCHDMIDAS